MFQPINKDIDYITNFDFFKESLKSNAKDISDICEELLNSERNTSIWDVTSNYSILKSYINSILERYDIMRNQLKLKQEIKTEESKKYICFSHELGNILSVLNLGYQIIELNREGLYGGDLYNEGSIIKIYLGKIKNSAKKLNSLLNKEYDVD